EPGSARLRRRACFAHRSTRARDDLSVRLDYRVRSAVVLLNPAVDDGAALARGQERRYRDEWTMTLRKKAPHAEPLSMESPTLKGTPFPPKRHMQAFSALAE